VLWVPETHAAANEHRGHGGSPTSCCRVPDSPRRSLYGSAHGAKFETRLRTSVPPCGGGAINPRSTPPRYSSRIQRNCRLPHNTNERDVTRFCSVSYTG
ncbi:unnamed protein product, partial [Ixodes persulcatus]